MKQKYFQSISITQLISITALITLFVLSVIFYAERTCFSDIAFQAFHIINTKNVFVQAQRFGAAFIHVFPLAGVLLNLPMKWVLILYSVSFIIENILLFLILVKWLKQKEVALILALFNVLLVSETFYWTTSEIKQGMSFSIFFAGVLLALPLEKFSSLKMYLTCALYMVLLTTLVFFHPLIIIPVIFVCGYLKLKGNIQLNKTLIFCAVMIAAIMAAKYFVIPIPWYDKQKYSGGKYFIDYFPNYFSLASFSKFVNYIIKDWYLYALMLLTVICFYAFKKMWLKLIWMVAFTLGYLLVVNVTHPNGADKFYIESFYLMLSIFVLFPFVFEVAPLMNVKIALSMIAVIFFLRLNTIYHAHKPFTERIVWINEMLKRNKGKFIVSEYHVPMQKLKMTWGVPYESILLSSIASPESARTFIILEDTYGKYAAYAETENNFYGMFGGVIDYKDINQDYFRLAPEKYRVLLPEEVIK
jgi:hypothetical protein